MVTHNNVKPKLWMVCIVFFVATSSWGSSASAFPSSSVSILQQATAAPTLAAPVVIPQPIENLTIRRGMAPENPIVGQPADVNLVLDIPADAACEGVPGQPVDAMFVFDISTSAGIGPGSNWETTLGLTRALLANLAQPIFQDIATSGTSQVGLVSSQTGTRGPEPVLLQPLTDNQDVLGKSLSSMSPSGDTDIAAGLAMAEKNLLDSKTVNRSQAIVIFLHDNVAFTEDTTKAIAEIMSHNILVFVVVNSLNIDTNKQITPEIAGSAVPLDQVFIDPDRLQVRRVFIAASRGSQKLAARSVEITENYSPDGEVDLLRPSLSGGVSNQTIQWHLAQMEAGSQNLSYQLVLKNPNPASLAIRTSASWIDCNGYPHSRTDTTGNIEAAGLTPVANPGDGTPGSDVSITSSGSDFSSYDLGIPFFMALPWLPDWLWLLLLLLPILLLLLWWLSRLFRTSPRRIPTPPPTPHPKLYEQPVIGDFEKKSPLYDNKIRPGVTTEYIDLNGDKKRLFISVEPKFDDPESFLSEGGKIVISRWMKPFDKESELSRITVETEKFAFQNQLTGESTTRTVSSITTFQIANPAAGYYILDRIVMDAKSLEAKELRYEAVPKNETITSILNEQKFKIDGKRAQRILE